MPMRVIAKKRCRAMVEPPGKGERAILNPNLSTRLNLLFSDQALGRAVNITARAPLAPSGPRLLDHLVGTGEQGRGHSKIESLGGFQIDGQLEFGRLLYGQVGWL